MKRFRITLKDNSYRVSYKENTKSQGKNWVSESNIAHKSGFKSVEEAERWIKSQGNSIVPYKLLEWDENTQAYKSIKVYNKYGDSSIKDYNYVWFNHNPSKAEIEKEFFNKYRRNVKVKLKIKEDHRNYVNKEVEDIYETNDNEKFIVIRPLKDSAITDTNIQLLGFKVEFVEGSHYYPKGTISLNEINKWLKEEDAKVQREYEKGYKGYDKAYVDIIFSADGKKYRIHGARVDLGDGKYGINKVQVGNDDINWAKGKLEEFLKTGNKGYGTVREGDSAINDMALSRADAMDRCINLGIKFIQHFDKIYKNKDTREVNHWAGEMSGWYKSVKQIKLKQSNSYILDGELRDWFFTAGANPQDFMSNPTTEELKAYDTFTTRVISGADVLSALKGVRLVDSIIKDTWKFVENYKSVEIYKDDDTDDYGFSHNKGKRLYNTHKKDLKKAKEVIDKDLKFLGLDANIFDAKRLWEVMTPRAHKQYQANSEEEAVKMYLKDYPNVDPDDITIRLIKQISSSNHSAILSSENRDSAIEDSNWEFRIAGKPVKTFYGLSEKDAKYNAQNELSLLYAKGNYKTGQGAELIEESTGRKVKVADSDKEFYKNAIEEMERYVSNWSFMSAKEKRDIGTDRNGLKRKIEEYRKILANLKDAGSRKFVKEHLTQVVFSTGNFVSMDNGEVYDKGYLGSKQYNGGKGWTVDEYINRLKQLGFKEVKDSSIDDANEYSLIKSRIEKAIAKNDVDTLETLKEKVMYATTERLSTQQQKELFDMIKAHSVKDAEITKESGTDKIIYTMQSNADKDLYFYIGKTYSMREGDWSYQKVKMGSTTPEQLKRELEQNGWHQVANGPAKIIDTSLADETYTYTMVGTTGRFPTKGLTKEQAIKLYKNNKLLGYDGEIVNETTKAKLVIRDKSLEELKKELFEIRHKLETEPFALNPENDPNAVKLLNRKLELEKLIKNKENSIKDASVEIRLEPTRNTWVGYENGKPTTEEFKTTRDLITKYPQFKLAEVIDYSIYDSNLEQIPTKARNELNNSKDKETTLLGILNELQQEVDSAKESEKETIKTKANKILSDLKKQFGLEDKTYIKLNDAHGDTMYFTNDTETLKASIIEVVNNEVPMITAVTPTRSQTFKTWDGAKRWLENKGYHKVSKEKYFSIRDEHAVLNNLMEASQKILGYNGNDNLTLKVKNTPFLLAIEKRSDGKYSVKIYISNGTTAQTKSVIIANTLEEAKTYGYTLLEEIKNYKG